VETYRQHLEAMVEERTGQLQTALRQIENTYEDTLQALGAAIDLRDNETAAIRAGSAVMPLKLPRLLAWRMRSSRIARGAYLHDIGSWEFPTASFSSRGPSPPTSEG